jgi:GNAT superfamily N-acetyltransferase
MVAAVDALPRAELVPGPGDMETLYPGDPERAAQERALRASLRGVRHHGGPEGAVAATLTSGSVTVLLDLHVPAAARRRGIGSALAVAAIRAAGGTAAVLAPTPATVPFYEALGFRLAPMPPDRAFYRPS